MKNILKKSELIIILGIFLLGFIWGIIDSGKFFFAIGGGLGLLAYSLPSTLITLLIAFGISKIRRQSDDDDSSEPHKPRRFFRHYLYNAVIIGSLLILAQVFDLMLTV